MLLGWPVTEKSWSSSLKCAFTASSSEGELDESDERAASSGWVWWESLPAKSTSNSSWAAVMDMAGRAMSEASLFYVGDRQRRV